MTQRKYPKS